MRSFKMDNSTKRLFEVVIDDLDEVLSQAVDKHEREEAFSNDGLDEILSQSLDMFEEVKNSVEDAIDITDMFDFGGPSLVMARRFATKKGEEIYILTIFMFYFLANSCYKENCYFKMYLVLLLVKCEEDKNRFQKGQDNHLHYIQY